VAEAARDQICKQKLYVPCNEVKQLNVVAEAGRKKKASSSCHPIHMAEVA